MSFKIFFKKFFSIFHSIKKIFRQFQWQIQIFDLQNEMTTWTYIRFQKNRIIIRIGFGQDGGRSEMHRPADILDSARELWRRPDVPVSELNLRKKGGSNKKTDTELCGDARAVYFWNWTDGGTAEARDAFFPALFPLRLFYFFTYLSLINDSNSKLMIISDTKFKIKCAYKIQRTLV